MSISKDIRLQRAISRSEWEARQAAQKHYQWLMDVSRYPEQYPEFIQEYLSSIMPQIGEWSVAGGVYNPAAVARKTSENLFPYLMSLGTTGAAGMAGAPGIMPYTGGRDEGGGFGGFAGGLLGMGLGAMMGGIGAPIGSAIGTKIGSYWD